jgi:hypothetical protein
MGITPGKPVTPADVDNIDNTSVTTDQLTINPTIGAGASYQALTLPNSYAIWTDNAGSGTAANRLWLDMPDTGDIILGPRSGTAFVSTLRLRTNATTASAANCFIDSTTQRISRSTSSRRYKVGIEDVEVDLGAFRRLRVVTFQDRQEHAEQGDAAPWYIGLVAEEVHDLGLHQLVAYMQTDDGPIPDGVQYDRLTLGLLQLAQAQQEQLDTLTTRLAQLEQTVAGMAERQEGNPA